MTLHFSILPTFGMGTCVTKLWPRKPINSALEEGQIHPKGEKEQTVTVFDTEARNQRLGREVWNMAFSLLSTRPHNTGVFSLFLEPGALTPWFSWLVRVSQEGFRGIPSELLGLAQKPSCSSIYRSHSGCRNIRQFQEVRTPVVGPALWGQHQVRGWLWQSVLKYLGLTSYTHN